MALSNMKLEPRREITESVLGILAFVGFVTGDYLLATWLKHEFPKDFGAPVPLFMIAVALVGFCGVAGLVGLTYITHAIGEEICDGLKKMGWDPRPTQRYRYAYRGSDGKMIRVRIPE